MSDDTDDSDEYNNHFRKKFSYRILVSQNREKIGEIIKIYKIGSIFN